MIDSTRSHAAGPRHLVGAKPAVLAGTRAKTGYERVHYSHLAQGGALLPRPGLHPDPNAYFEVKGPKKSRVLRKIGHNKRSFSLGSSAMAM
jgi:hypothetical protein